MRNVETEDYKEMYMTFQTKVWGKGTWSFRGEKPHLQDDKSRYSINGSLPCPISRVFKGELKVSPLPAGSWLFSAHNISYTKEANLQR